MRTIDSSMTNSEIMNKLNIGQRLVVTAHIANTNSMNLTSLPWLGTIQHRLEKIYVSEMRK
jgi:hypothetical protein